MVTRQANILSKLSVALAVSLFFLVAPRAARAQSSEQTFSFSAEAQANSSTVGNIFTVAPQASYNYNDHFGIDVGVPFHFTRDPSYFSNSSLNPMWNDGVGMPYIRARYMRNFSGVTYASMLTGLAPVGSYAKGLNTGRVGVEWFNHVDGAVGRFTPFGNVALANGILDRNFVSGPYNGFRPYQTLGFVSDLEGGTTFKVHRRLSVGGSAFWDLPAGRQKVFSRLVAQGTFVPGFVQNNRFFQHEFETEGPSSIAKDDGLTGWGTFTLTHNLDLQVGYTRSVRYALNSWGVTLAFNPTSFARILWR